MLEIEVEVITEEVVTRGNPKRWLQKQLSKGVFQKQLFLIVTIYNEISYNFINVLEK